MRASWEGTPMPEWFRVWLREEARAWAFALALIVVWASLRG